MTSRRLFISKVDSTFNPNADIAFGPWCFIGAEDIYSEWETIEFIDPFIEHKKLVEAERLSRRLADRLVPVWAVRLNERHGIDRSFDFWRFTLILWLLVSIQALWTRYRHAEKFIEKHGDQNLSVNLTDGGPPVRSQGFMDFQHQLRRNPQFEEWISSLVIRELAPDNWNLNTLDTATPDSQPELVSNERKSRLGAVVRKVFGRLPFDSAAGVKFAKIPFSIYLSMLPNKGRGAHHYNFDDATVLDAFPARFLDLLDRFLMATLPSDYDENFGDIYAEVMTATTKSGKIYIGGFMPSDERRRLELANAVDKGEKLVATQHGAGYGTSELLTWGVALEYPYHAMITWGWTEQSDFQGRFIRLPSPLLGRLRNKHREKNSRLIMPATKIDFRGTRLIEGRPQHMLQYRRDKITFIELLDTAPRRELVYYPYKRGKMDLEDETFLKRHINGLNLATGDLVADMLDCRLLVLDNGGTTLNLAMAANLPLVCYWNPDAWTYASQAQPYFDRLRKCGILHDTPAEAAAHINAHWNDIASWWRSETVQTAHKEWCKRYAYSKRFWWIDWMRALAAL